MYDALKTLMVNRYIRVKVGDTLSSERILDMGVAQGTIYAPICFSIMLHDIKNLKLNNASIMLYADDLTLWQESKYMKINTHRQSKEIREKFQSNVNIIINYMNSNGFVLAPEKTKLLIFKGLKRSILSHEIYITVNGQRVSVSKTAKYLGVIFDESLNFKPHIESQIKKIKSLWPLLKILKNTPGCCSTKPFLQVAKALVRGRITHGQEAYFTASPYDLRKLQNAETAVLRFILGLGRGTSPSLVYREAGWLPLPDKRKLRCAQYLVRAKSVTNSTSFELNIDFDNSNSDSNQKVFNKKPYLKSKALSFYNFTEELLNKANIDSTQINQTPTPSIPIWTEIFPTTDYNYCDVTKTQDPLLVATLANEKINNSYLNSLQIYTDGSKLENGDVGCSFCIPSLGITKYYKLNSDVSIMSAELYAIYMALAFIADCPRTFFKVVILTDSKSALQAIDSLSKNRQNLIFEIIHLNTIISQKGTELDMVWIPSHCNISGNEKADKAAKIAAKSIGPIHNLGHSTSELCAKLKTAAWGLWADNLKAESERRSWNFSTPTTYNAPLFLSSHLQALFHRIRVGISKFHFCEINCVCNAILTCKHIFTCQQLRCFFPKTLTILQRNQLPFQIQYVTMPLNGSWDLVEIFIKELLETPIAYAL